MYSRNRLWSFVSLYALIELVKNGVVRYPKGDDDEEFVITIGADKLRRGKVVNELVAKFRKKTQSKKQP